MFMIDPKGILVYQGAIDDIRGTKPGERRHGRNYVARRSMKRCRAKPVSIPSTKSSGCSVKYQLSKNIFRDYAERRSRSLRMCWTTMEKCFGYLSSCRAWISFNISLVRNPADCSFCEQNPPQSGFRKFLAAFILFLSRIFSSIRCFYSLSSRRE